MSTTPALDAAAKSRILIACILGTTVVTVDSTAVNVALPAIAEDLGGGLAGQQWTSNAYLLTLGSLLLIGGSLGDLLGERRIFVLGVGGFGVTSLLCAIAPTIGTLVAARALQGVCGALLTPAALAVIVRTFTEAERGRAVGQWTAWGGRSLSSAECSSRPAPSRNASTPVPGAQRAVLQSISSGSGSSPRVAARSIQTVIDRQNAGDRSVSAASPSWLLT